MEFAGMGDADDVAEVGGVDSGAGNDFDSAICGLHELGDDCGAFERGTPSARGEDTGGPSRDYGFESGKKIRSLVEGAMKGDGKRTGEFDENAGLFDIYCTVRMEDAEDKAVHAAGLGEDDFGAHLGEFGCGIDEVFGSRADHGEDGEFCAGASVAHESFGRSEATDGKIFAELDAIGVAPFGGDGAFEGFNGDFEKKL